MSNSLSRARFLVAAPAFVLGFGLAAPASAQLLQDAPTVVVPAEQPITTARSTFARDQAIGVADRMPVAFSAQGATIGAFDVFPGLAIGSVYTSNAFANNDNRHGDVALVVRPELTVRTSSGPYQVAAFGMGDFRRYSRFQSENSEEGLGGLEASVAVGPLSTLTAGASYGSFIEPRYAADSPINAAKPLEYTGLNAFAGATIEGATTRLILRADVAQLEFRNTPSTTGGTLLTRDRDRTRYQGLIRLERALSPAVSVYGATTLNKIDYRFTSCCGASRDSNGYGVYVGTSFEASALMRGDIRVGYIHQNFDLANVRPINGFGALAKVVYFPNRLWTITASGESSVQDSGVPGSGGFTHRGGSLRVDNELRRYIMASLEAGYFRDTYSGLPRRDNLPFVDAGLTYLSRNHWNARLGYRYIARSCSCSTGVTDFDDHRVSAMLTFQI